MRRAFRRASMLVLKLGIFQDSNRIRLLRTKSLIRQDTTSGVNEFAGVETWRLGITLYCQIPKLLSFGPILTGNREHRDGKFTISKLLKPVSAIFWTRARRGSNHENLRSAATYIPLFQLSAIQRHHEEKERRSS
jgi:hypothetical protein